VNLSVAEPEAPEYYVDVKKPPKPESRFRGVLHGWSCNLDLAACRIRLVFTLFDSDSIRKISNWFCHDYKYACLSGTGLFL